MQLISIGNVIVNLDQVSALDIHRREDGGFVVRILKDSSDPIAKVNLAPEVPDLLLGLVPAKARFVGVESPDRVTVPIG